MSDADPRLPRLAVPAAYRLELAPDIDAGTFAGIVEIDLDITTATHRLICNAAELTIREAVFQRGDALALEITLDDELERLTLTADQSMEAGPGTLRIAFDGILNDQLHGFYRSTYETPDGESRTIATTQFQSTDARRAFPCWDEPEWKATFETTLVVDQSHLAVSNTLPVDETSLDDGRRRVRFAPTMLMSTYLVAFVVGPLEATEPVDVRGIPLRIVHRPGQAHLTPFALEVAAHGLAWLADYYDIPYPGDKVDLIAIPDFAFGAMENLGCITFRERLLLADPADSTQAELQRIADVTNHELAHMWFGDLVTMMWWEGIWLNEAFATFMEVATSAAFRPAWRSWEIFARIRTDAFDVDALATTRPIEFPVHTPEEAEAMFDTLTYEKGAAVVRMLEQHLTSEVFRNGVRHYLRTHAYGNTETNDLWDALEEVSGAPVQALMESWILQGGHPLVEMEKNSHGLTVTQMHFTLDPTAGDQRTWAVPLRLRGPHGDDRLLLDTPARTITGQASSAAVVNGGGVGFFRSGARPESLDYLEAADLHTLADDTWTLTVAGRRTASECLADLEKIARATDDHITWQALAAAFAGLARLLPEGTGAPIETRIRTASRPALDRLGIEPRSGEPEHRRELRGTLVTLLGRVAADDEVIARAPELLDHPEPEVSAAALLVAARHGTESTRETIRERWQSATEPQAEGRYLRALADFSTPELVDPLLEDVRSGEVRTQDAPLLLARALVNRRTNHHVWDAMKAAWEDLNDRFPSNTIVRMLAGVPALDQPDDPADVAEFLAAHPVPQAGMQLEQLLERQRINTAFRTRETKRFPRDLVR